MKLLTPQEIFDLDRYAVEKFNSYSKRNPDHVLHFRTGAFVPTRNILTAPVVLLLANPGYSDDPIESPDMCEQYEIEGWPFSHLHPDAPAGASSWTRKRLRLLIEKFGAHFVAQNVACAQLTPWASKRFHGNEGLPSRAYILEVVKRASENGALVLVMRGRKLWSDALKSDKVMCSKNPRSAFVTPGNFENFEKIITSLENCLIS